MSEDPPPIQTSERPAYPTRASLRGRTPRAAAAPPASGAAPPTAPIPKISPAATPAAPPVATRTAPSPVAPASPIALVRNLPKAVAALVALAGAVLIGVGVLQGTVLKPASTTTASLADPPAQPVVVSQAGLMGLDGPRVQISVNGASSKPVFLGIGRAADVQAYLADVKHLTVTGEDGQGALTTKTGGSQASLPDPANADVWIVSQRARGAVTLNWPNVAGQWVAVAATNGTAAAPPKLTFTWSGRTTKSSGAGFIAVGAVLLVCGLVLLVMLISRSKQERLP